MEGCALGPGCHPAHVERGGIQGWVDNPGSCGHSVGVVVREAAEQWKNQTTVTRMSTQGHFQPKAAGNPATDKYMLTTMSTIDDINSSNTLPTDILKDETLCDLEVQSQLS